MRLTRRQQRLSFDMQDDQFSLFNYPTAPHNGTDTSREAAASIVDQVNGLCRDVLCVIRRAQNGLTCDEVEELLGMKHQTASARIRDLTSCQPALLEQRIDSKTGKHMRRLTRSGRTARVYFASP